MSSTNRGAARVEGEFYPTPPWCTLAIMRRLFGPAGQSLSIVDPCAGDGAIFYAVRRWASTARFKGIEIDPWLAGMARGLGFDVETRDALGPAAWPKAEAIITNPPFSLARDFVDRALGTSAHTVAMLLRLGWLEGAKRADFHRAYPANVYVLPRRPSFLNRGTDSAAYAWFVWQTDAPGGHWEILDLKGCFE